MIRDDNLVRNPLGPINECVGPGRAILWAGTSMGLELGPSVQPGVIVYIYNLFILILYIFIHIIYQYILKIMYNFNITLIIFKLY
jgi:hypothetical protein